MFNIVHEDDFRILDYLEPGEGQVLVDAGANRGDAIQSMLMKQPLCRVVAFEPNPVLVEKLKRIYRNDPRVRIEAAGLGSKDIDIDLHLPFYRNYMFDGLASFRKENARDWLRTRIYGFRPEHLSIRKVSCTINRLDRYHLNPAFIKVDVQGYEREVLLGAAETLKNARPVLLIETPGESECRLLRELRYAPFVLVNGTVVEGTGNYNVLFFPDERVPALTQRLKAASFAPRPEMPAGKTGF